MRISSREGGEPLPIVHKSIPWARVHPRRVAGRSPVEPPPAQGWGERCPKKTDGNEAALIVSLSMRLKIPSHNGLLDSLRSHSTLHAHAHERSLKLTCRTGGRWLTPRDIQALHVRHDVGHHVQFASMVMSSVMCECSGSVSAKMAIISSMSMLSASAIMAFAGAACNSRTALGVSDASCGSRFGYFEPVICHTCSLLEIAFCAISEVLEAS